MVYFAGQEVLCVYLRVASHRPSGLFGLAGDQAGIFVAFV